MQITIDTGNLTEIDLSILQLLAGSPAPTEAEPAKPAAKKAEPKPAAKKAEPAPAAEDEPAATGEDDGPTLADAVKAATELVSNGETAKVKAALDSVGAKRVSEVAEKDIEAFLSALGQ